MSEIKKTADYFLENFEQNKIEEPNSEYQSKEDLQRSKSFNGLSAKEWASMSKNVWNDLSSPRNKYQLEHGAVFPVKLAERLIKMYSKKGDAVFDPFLGIGSTLIAAQNLERHCIGIELNPKFSSIAEKWSSENLGLFRDSNKYHYKIVNDDCRNLENYIRPNKIQLTVTSPPYADFIQKSLKDRVETHKTSIIKHKNNSTVKQYYQQLLQLVRLQ
jgi:DNA modification methylase